MGPHLAGAVSYTHLDVYKSQDIKGEEVLRVLLYQDSKAVPMISLLEKSLGDRTAGDYFTHFLSSKTLSIFYYYADFLR